MKPQHVTICIPVTGSTMSEFLENLETAQQQSDYVELRVDYIEGFTTKDLDLLKKNTFKKAIVTCRWKEEGGNFVNDEQFRLEILQRAIDLEFPYVDIELSTIEKHTFKRNSSTKIIVSHHDFSATPNYWDLTKILDTMRSYGPDIVKIATMATTETDSVTLMRLLTNKKPSERMIIIGMGPFGKVTRIMAPLLGGYFTFASTANSSTAPGQIDINELKKLYTAIDKL